MFENSQNSSTVFWQRRGQKLSDLNSEARFGILSSFRTLQARYGVTHVIGVIFGEEYDGVKHFAI